MVTIESARLTVSDADLTRFLAPRLARKGIRNLGLTFEPDLVHVQADYPLNRFGFGEITAKATVRLSHFDAEKQILEFSISDVDLHDANPHGGLLGKMLGHAVKAAKKVTGGEVVKFGLEFLRGRVTFLDVDAPGLRIKLKVHTLAVILQPYVKNLRPDALEIRQGTLTLIQSEHGQLQAAPQASEQQA